jgi:outer membrane protein TolC
MKLLGGLLASLFSTAGMSESQREPLPSPLTLEQALTLADQSHPDRELADAALQMARAELAGVEADDDLQVDFTAVLSAVDPSPNAVDQSSNDSWARLRLSKLLHDFGRTERAQAAADARQQGQLWHLLEVRQKRYLEVMARFFDVLLADLEYARDNEAMATAFVSLDRARGRSELGQLSDIELLELENRYQQARRRMTGSQNKQRITRSLLAISLNRPDDLPGELDYPAEDAVYQQEEIEVLVQRILAGNPGLRALRAEVESAEQRLWAADAAGLVLEVPLFDGRRVDAKKALQRARLRGQRARLAAHELDLRQQLLEDWLELQRLRIRREELAVTADFRDLYLERSRSLYDLEVASDLGDSMVRIADLHLQQAENDFQIRLLSARLDALAGRLLPDETR